MLNSDTAGRCLCTRAINKMKVMMTAYCQKPSECRWWSYHDFGWVAHRHRCYPEIYSMLQVNVMCKNIVSGNDTADNWGAHSPLLSAPYLAMPLNTLLTRKTTEQTLLKEISLILTN